MTNSIAFRGKQVMIDGLHSEAAVNSTQFIEWLDWLDEDLLLTHVDFQSIDIVGPPHRPVVLFAKFKADMMTKGGAPIPSITFMRGGSVGFLAVLIDVDSPADKYISLVVQPRCPIGKSAFPEIPAGMLDGSGNFASKAANELREETGILVSERDLISLEPPTWERHRFRGAYPSPGGTDEFVRLFYREFQWKRTLIETLQGRLTGNYREGEHIAVQVVPIEEVPYVTSDMKTLTALFLYDLQQQTLAFGA
jgi:ADP-sugar diphosphatase